MKPAHTPGPWATNGRRVESEREHGYVNDGWIVAACEGPDWEANVRLLAAAPELLSALQVTVRFLDPGSDLRRIAEAAIAKATANRTGQ